MCDVFANWCNKNKLSLNALKIIFMIMSRKHLDASFDLYISINNTKIFPCMFFFLLFALLSAQLATACGCQAYFALVVNCIRATRGCDKRRVTCIYKTVVEPILLNSCAVWASFIKTKRGVKLLRNFKRSATLLIIQAFKTAPNDTLLVFSNLPSIELQ